MEAWRQKNYQGRERTRERKEKQAPQIMKLMRKLQRNSSGSLWSGRGGLVLAADTVNPSLAQSTRTFLETDPQGPDTNKRGDTGGPRGVIPRRQTNVAAKVKEPRNLGA